MGWDNRDYYREGRYAGGPALGRIGGLLNSSLPLGAVAGIRIRVHVTFLLMAGFELLTQGDPLWTLRWSALLFGSVLLHEFGHCFGCRAVGGQADRILMWPLGGLAFTAPPRRPGAEFVTVACGPLVNLLLAAGCYAALRGWEYPASSFFAFDPFKPRFFFAVGGVAGVLRDLYVVNYSLLLFNLMLVFYPFDGGRLVQIALWVKFGYARSMHWAATFGLWAAVAIFVGGIATGSSSMMLLALFGGLACYQQLQLLRMEGPGMNLYQLGAGGRPSDGFTPAHAPSGGGWLSRWQTRRAARGRERSRREREAQTAEVDAILDKVRERGLHSLNRHEKKVLQRATERQRSAG